MTTGADGRERVRVVGESVRWRTGEMETTEGNGKGRGRAVGEGSRWAGKVE